MFYHLFETSIGWIGIAWTERGIARLLLPQRDVAAMERKLAAEGATPSLPSGSVGDVVSRIRAYADGHTVEFDDVAVDFGAIDDFRKAIYDAARRLCFGHTTTYGALAADAGHPGLARETGTALGQNPVPLIVPCHRILAAGNNIGGFSAPGGSATKEKMLKLEGVSLAKPAAAQAAFAF